MARRDQVIGPGRGSSPAATASGSGPCRGGRPARTVTFADGCLSHRPYADGSTATASIEMSRPRGSTTLAGAERAGAGSGMKRA